MGCEPKRRKKCNTTKRKGQWETYKKVLNYYKKQIRVGKRSSWKGCCQEISDVLGSVRLMKIMEKQITYRVSTIKLPADRYN
jgi:hypothetical protein